MVSHKIRRKKKHSRRTHKERNNNTKKKHRRKNRTRKYGTQRKAYKHNLEKIMIGGGIKEEEIPPN